MSEGNLARALLLGKPYFGSEMAALQGPPVRHAILDALARLVANRKKDGPVRILEIGSWAGASAVTFGMCLRSLQRKGEILCVDVWKPYLNVEVDKDDHYIQMQEAAESRAIFQLFRHNLAASKVEDLVRWLVGESNEILPTLKTGTFDLIYIDGSHIYRQVFSDITNAKKLVADGGILAGDDMELERSEVDSTAHQSALSAERDYIEDPRTGRYYHPGVTEAVSESFSSVSRFEGVWAVSRTGGAWTNIDLQSLPLELPPHIQAFAERQNKPAAPHAELLEEGSLFNLVKMGDEFIALAKVLGPTALMLERLGERDLGNLLLKDKNLEQLRTRIQAIEKEHNKPTPELVRQIPHYNLIRLGSYFAAVSTALGPTSLLVETLGERELGELVLLDSDLDRLEQRAALAATGSKPPAFNSQ